MNNNSPRETQKINTFQDLHAWQAGHSVVLATYSATKQFPREEMLGLSSQMQRAAVSITSNIAEGFGRRSYKEKVRFYAMAQGSITELQNQLIIARDIAYLDQQTFSNIYDESITTHKIITGLIRGAKKTFES